jgi:hypothetical protein
MSFEEREPIRKRYPSGPYSNVGPVACRLRHGYRVSRLCLVFGSDADRAAEATPLVDKILAAPLVPRPSRIR